MKIVGVLALQGAFREHIKILKHIGVKTREVRLPKDLEDLSGLIIPGGESTTIYKLANWYGLIDPICRFAENHALWGTCAGMIFMAKQSADESASLGIMDIVVKRNAFGRQVDSFEEDLFIRQINAYKQGPFPAIFIRAPKLMEAGKNVEIIARLSDQTAVAARENRFLVTAFHPELSQDDRLHHYFLDLM